MSQQAIPCVLMRAGSSRGPFFLASDLPSDRGELSALLLRVMGSPDARQIDGLGGATTVTSKVAIVSPSDVPGVDVDFLFAQVEIERADVDWAPTCGNMLAGVAPFAIEHGLVAAADGETHVVVRAVNTDTVIDAVVQTPGGAVTWAGRQAMAGVPGTAAPIQLLFRSVSGTHTGRLLPTGNVVDLFDGVEATCVDAVMPTVHVRAVEMGFTATEPAAEIHGDVAFMARMERIRRLAGEAMGFGDVSRSVVPKFAMVAPPVGSAHLAARYLTPSQCHPAYALSGSISAASGALVDGSIVAEVVRPDARMPELVEIEHPSGSIEVALRADVSVQPPLITAGGSVRTARPIMRGEVLVPS
ncbi:MAG: PrpF domain-containing protein [Actinomycetota bacterium]